MSKDCANAKVWKGNASQSLSDHVSKYSGAHVSMVQHSNHVSYQLPNHTNRVRKLIRSVESTDPKLLAAIAKVEIDDDSMSDFEAIAACVLLCDPAANNKASAKSDRHDMLEANASSMVRGRTRKNLDLRFYDQK